MEIYEPHDFSIEEQLKQTDWEECNDRYETFLALLNLTDLPEKSLIPSKEDLYNYYYSSDFGDDYSDCESDDDSDLEDSDSDDSEEYNQNLVEY